ASARELFFFSGRRRHTRWPRDWSSDVCSSDLPADPLRGDHRPPCDLLVQADAAGGDDLLVEGLLEECVGEAITDRAATGTLFERSEERRVGKESRSWWAP